MIDFAALVAQYGYFGIFIISIIGSASIFIPLPTFLLVVSAGATMNPLLVGLIAGLGATIGETLGYYFGVGLVAGGKKLTKRKLKPHERKWVIRIKDWFNRGWGPLVIFVVAATPLPDKILGVVCGALKYDVRKFFLATLIGKVLLHLALAYIGFYGIELLV